MKVTHMVCPDCARMHGADHYEHCPRAIQDDPPPGFPVDAYTRGWRHCRDYMALAISREMSGQEKRIADGIEETVKILTDAIRAGKLR